MYARFDLSTLEGVSSFDNHLNGFCALHGIGLGLIALPTAHQRLFERHRRVFYTLVDLKLCLMNTLLAGRDLERTRRRNDIMEMFLFQKAWFCFVTSYRSFYDKFMNLIVEACYPDKLEAFERGKGKSKKKAFVSLVRAQAVSFPECCEAFIGFPPEFVDWMEKFISFVDDQYRTAEVHGSGRARKWIFSEADLSKTPYGGIGEFVDHLGQFIHMAAYIATGDPSKMDAADEVARRAASA